MIKENYLKVLKWIKEHKYCLAMLYVPVYLLTFFLTNGLYEPVVWVHHPLDDLIPFEVNFVIIYMLWFPAIMLALVKVMFRCEKDFKQLAFVMFTGMTISLIIYAIYPTGLKLRPEIEVNGFSTWLMSMVWKNDVPMNVCPSIHVSSSIAVFFVAFRGEYLRGQRLKKAAVMIFMIAICVSTVFVKQHSVVDVFYGALLSAVLYVISEIVCITKERKA
ncbi:MAG: phosphatase PAP2 family protein [Lachnospiraceae bacterium]|nr:phosphatase PAP2 family protein [Lachnospiraceae bacterium]